MPWPDASWRRVAGAPRARTSTKEMLSRSPCRPSGSPPSRRMAAPGTPPNESGAPLRQRARRSWPAAQARWVFPSSSSGCATRSLSRSASWCRTPPCRRGSSRRGTGSSRACCAPSAGSGRSSRTAARRPEGDPPVGRAAAPPCWRRFRSTARLAAVRACGPTPRSGSHPCASPGLSHPARRRPAVRSSAASARPSPSRPS
mmetsp:Transcript_46635/g.139239  ORF Transcript_46635/g.139239 Transcript_46635/m.139239 type:complete len:201 (+) Transcript_46635:93-695(+)